MPRSGVGPAIAGTLLRLSLGATFIAHGLHHGRTLDGTAKWFGSIGFREPELQAKLSAAVEIASGSAVLLGAATPLGAAAMVGTMAVAGESVHRKNGFFITGEGYEYVLALGTAATALAALGGGPFSVDRLLGLERRLSGARGAALAFGLGVAGAAGQLAMFWTRPVPEGEAESVLASE
jgi:putative oxidoreductase